MDRSFGALGATPQTPQLPETQLVLKKDKICDYQSKVDDMRLYVTYLPFNYIGDQVL